MKFKKVETRIRKSIHCSYWYPEYRVIWFSIFFSEWKSIYCIKDDNNVSNMHFCTETAKKVIDDFIARDYAPVSNDPQTFKYT